MSAARLFKRAIRVTYFRQKLGKYFAAGDGDPQANAIVITDHRVQFSIVKSIEKEPNAGEITITNLAKTTRSFVEHKPGTVIIEIGYDGRLHHLYTGDLRLGYSEINGADWETKLTLGDGDRAYQFARVSRSYGKGTKILTAVRDAALSMGLQLPANVLKSSLLKQEFSGGVLLSGAARDELSRLLAPYGYSWSCQNGQMQILLDTEVREDQAHLVDASSGMIGSPSYHTPKEAGKSPSLQFKSLARPSLMPGGKLQMQSRDVSGIFRMEKITFSGDNLSGDFMSEVEAKPIT